MDHLLVFTSRTTADSGSVRRVGRTRTTASRCTACGSAHDVETTTEPTLTISLVSARAERCCREAARRWRVHPTVGAHTGEGLKTAPRAHFLSSRWVAHQAAASVARSLRHGLKRAREKESGR
jgi:hypothetical protein